MKKLLTILLTLFLFSSVYAEARVVDELEYKDFVAYAVGENKAYTGIYEWHYSNGQIGRQATYKDGLKHGELTTWWDFGDKKAIIDFYKGEAKEDIYKSNISTNLDGTYDEKYTGEYVEIDDRGWLKRRTFYKNGLKHGKSTEFARRDYGAGRKASVFWKDGILTGEKIAYNYDGSEKDFLDYIRLDFYDIANWIIFVVVIYGLIALSKKTILLVIGSFFILVYLSLGEKGLGMIAFLSILYWFVIAALLPILWFLRKEWRKRRK
jgi:antitoxin component YwqK of YwqJK toxin-antitoxin module